MLITLFLSKICRFQLLELKNIEIFDTGQDDGYLHYQGTKPVWEPP